MRIGKLIGIRKAGRIGVIVALAIAAGFTGAARAETDPVLGPNAALPGAKIYAERCAQCHDHPTGRIPPRTFLSVVKTPEQVVTALTKGVMQSQATGLGVDQIKALAVFVSGKEFGGNSDPNPNANLCPAPAGPIAFGENDWPGWGHDFGNTRFQAKPGIAAGDVPKLKPKWVFTYPGHVADSEPVSAGGVVYVGNRAGWVFALDSATGCTHWSFEAEGGVHAALVVAPLPQPAPAKAAAYVTTENGYLHALDAQTGAPIWTTRVEDHPATHLTGSPVFYKGRLYVPLASFEEVSVFNENYACCTFRGGLVAVDAASGKIAWKTYTIPDEPKEIGANAAGIKLFGPAGVAIFSSPTVDPKRRAIYVGTGNSYTQTSLPMANAVMAFDMDSGKMRWTTQTLSRDDLCPKAQGPEHCEHTGPDLDFAAAPILRRTPSGKDILVAISKADEIFGFDPDVGGKLLWRQKLGKGSKVAGVWGLAADDHAVYAGGADVRPEPGLDVGGLNAIDFATGKLVWRTPAPKPVCGWGDTSSAIAVANGAVGCSPATPGAITMMPGVIFSGSVDGHMRAYAQKDGALVWDFDTGHGFKAVNGVDATGGSISNGASAIAGGTLFVNSGSAGVHQSGNALFAFTVDGK